MDIVTHGLASLALARGIFPRVRGVAVIFVVLAGTIADVDWLSRYWGALSFFAWHGTYLHSLPAAILFSLIPLLVFQSLVFVRGEMFVVFGELKDGEALAKEPSAIRAQAGRIFLMSFFAAPLFAALLHVAMDACQSDGVMLMWPFSSKRFAADWLPLIDPWILTILMLAIGVPELLRLVSSEIGAKSKQPRGRTGALIGLALVAAYIGGRGMLHSNAVALMESRTFHGEPARRALAFPEAFSPLSWHGVVETEGSIDEIDVNLAATGAFDPDTSARIFKPEQSAILDVARNTRVAKQFLAAAQMPKASVEKTDVGSVVILRDMRYAASGETQREIAALIELDPENRVTAQEIVWARELRGPQ